MRGRFAPSPTGELHLGNARTALLTWLQVRSLGGTLVMRVEDLDPLRSRAELAAAQFEDLRWLGLDWDEGPETGGPHAPYHQSARSDHYGAALEQLSQAGLLYACTCSRKDIAAASSAPHQADDEGPRYPGTCRNRPPAQTDTPTALRFRVPPGVIQFDDLVQGHQRFSLAEAGGDFVVLRKDGVAAYQLAVTVDDAAMRISHVLRGSDLLISTARQIALYRALGLEPPTWAHVPLLLGPDGERLAKRHGSVTIRSLREAGVLPEAVVGWLAHSCRLRVRPDEVRPADLVADFDPARLPTADTVVAELPFRKG